MKTKLKTTLALLAAFCGLQLFTATTAWATTKTWTQYCYEKTYLAEASAGITQYDKSQNWFAFRVNLTAESMNGAQLVKYGSSNSNYNTIKTTSDGKYCLEIWRSGKTTLTKNSTVSVTAGTHNFAMLVRRGASDANQLISVILYMDGSEIVKIVHGQDGVSDSETFAGNPMANFTIGQEGKDNRITLYRTANDGTLPTKANGYATDTATMAQVMADANELFPPLVAYFYGDTLVDGATYTGAGGVQYTLNANGNTAVSGGIQISANKGISVTPASGNIGNQATTVVIRYTNFDTSSLASTDAKVLIVNHTADTSYKDMLGMAATEGGNIWGLWQNTTWSNNKTTTGVYGSSASDVKQFALGWTQTATAVASVGAYFYMDGQDKAGWSSLHGSKDIDSVWIGGPNEGTGVTPATGMKILGIAVFGGRLSDADMAAYSFPLVTYTATVSGNTKFSEITTWSPARPMTFDSYSKIVINNTAAAKLTMDEDVTAGTFAIQNTSGNGLTLGLDGHCITATWDQSGAAGGVTVDATGISSTILTRYAVAGAPYSYWYIRGAGTLPNNPSTMPTVPSGYSVAAEKYTGTGLRLVVTAPDTAKNGSVNINFMGNKSQGTSDNNAKVGTLSTNVGAFPIVGTSWNDLEGKNQTGTSVKYVKADGTVVTDAGITLTASQVNNAYGSGAANNMLITGYMDDSKSPIVQISNIPFAKYRVIFYRATDEASKTFSAAQIGTTASNAKIYYGPNKSSETAGKTLFGASEVDWGKSDWRTGYAESVNYIVSDVLEGTPGSATAYIYSHKHAGRAGVAAIQIVEVGVVAKIGDTVYSSLAEAEAAVTSGETIKLLVDCDEVLSTAKTFTFDYNGHAFNGGFVIGDGGAVTIAGTIDNAKHRYLLAHTTGNGWLKMNVGNNNIELQIWSDKTPHVANVNVEYLGTGQIHFVGEDNADKDKYTVSAGKTVKFENGTIWAKRSIFEVYGNLIAKAIKLGHEQDGAYTGKVTAYDGAVVKTGSVTFANKGGSSAVDVKSGGVLEFTQNSTSAIALVSSDKTYSVTLNGGTLRSADSSWKIASGISVSVAANSIISVADGKMIEFGNTFTGSGTFAYTGSGTICYNGGGEAAFPTAPNSVENWTGTVWLKNFTNSVCRDFGGFGAKVKFSNVLGWLNSGTFSPTLELDDAGNDNPALNLNNGSSGWTEAKSVTFNKLTGTGTLKTSWSHGTGFPLLLKDTADFHGSLNASVDGIGIFVGPNVSYATKSAARGQIVLAADATATIESGKRWKANSGIFIRGTLGGAGTLASNTTFEDNATIDARTAQLTASGTLSLGTDVKVRVATAPTTTAAVKVFNGTGVGNIADVKVYVGDSTTAEEGTFKLFYMNDGVYVASYAAHEYTLEADTTWAEFISGKTFGAYDNITIAAGGHKLTFTEKVTATYNLTISGDVTIAAGDALYHNGCWEDVIATFAQVTISGTLTSEIKSGFNGAFSTTANSIKLRAQNREVISINIGGGNGGGTTGEASPAANLVPSNTTYYGLAPVKGETWNNISRQWQGNPGTTQTITLKGSKAAGADGTLTQRPTIDLSATAKNTYSWGCTDCYLTGYLDDGGGVNVSVHGVPYSTYDVIVYATSDSGAKLQPMTINGVQYTFKDGATQPGSDSWGVGQTKTAQFGKNALYVSGLTGEELSIVATRVGNPRATVCAVQVINQGEIAIKSTYVADVTAASVTWTDGEDQGLTTYGDAWANSQLSTLTLTNTVASTLSFGKATTGQVFKVVSAAGYKMTIPYSSLEKMTFSMLDFTEAFGKVEIDMNGVTEGAEGQTILAGTLTGTTNVTYKSTGAWGAYADATGIHMAPKADTSRNNPVTGDSQNFTFSYFGTDGVWEKASNWRKAEDGLWRVATVVPGDANGGYEPLMIDADKNVAFTGDELEGYMVRYAFLGGADVTVSKMKKFQTDDKKSVQQFIWVDKDSAFTVSDIASNDNWDPVDLYVAAENGITFPAIGLSKCTFNYYFTNNASVKFTGALTAGTHTIKQMDLTVGTTEKMCHHVEKKKLVTLAANSTVTFAKDENIVVNLDNKDVTPAYIETIPACTNDVGTYTIKTESTGVYAYVVQYADQWDIIEPLTGTLTADTPWSSIVWKDFYDHEGADLTLPHTYKVKGGDYTATQSGSVVAGSEIEIVSGTLELATGATIGTETYKIDTDAMLLVKVSGLTASKVTNNGGTLKFQGGDSSSPIAVTGNGNLTATLAASTYVKNTIDNNHIHNITGADATSFYALGKASGGVGFTDGTTFANLTLVSDCATGEKLWIERSTYDNVGFVANTEFHLNGLSPTIVSLSGAGSVTRAGGTETLTIACTAASDYSGASTVPFTIGTCTAVQTLSGAYTGALTVNADGQVKLAGSAVPSSITSAGAVTFDYGAGTTKTATIASNTGTITINSGTVVLKGYRGAVTLGTDAKVGYTVDINDCGEFTPPQGVDINSVELYRADGTKITTQISGGKLTYTWEITGNVCYWDYEFNEAGRTTTVGPVNTGSEGTAMTFDGDRPSTVKGKEFVTNIVEEGGVPVTNILLRVPSRPWRDVSSWPTKATFMFYGTMVGKDKAYQIAFGSKNSSGNQLFFATKSVKDGTVDLCYSVNGAEPTILCTMSVANAQSANHLYAVVLKDDGNGNSVVNTYLDGVLLQPYTHTGTLTLGAGFQIASGHGGVAEGGYGRPDENDPALMDWLRVYNVELTQKAMTEYAKLYPYTSVNGKATRTVTDADTKWVEEGKWTQALYGGGSFPTNTPSESTEVEVTVASDTSLELNLDENAKYESLKIKSDDGAALTLTKGTNEDLVVPSVPGTTTIGTDVTVDYDAIIFGNVTVEAGKKLTFDLSHLDLTKIYANTNIQLTGTAILEDGATITTNNLTAVRGHEVTLDVEQGQYHLNIAVTPEPFIYTIAQGEATGKWSCWGVDLAAEPDWAAVGSGEIQKAGDGTTTLEQKAGFNYTVNADGGTLMFSSVVGNAASITVNNGGTFDLNGKSGTAYGITLAGGSLVNNGAKIGDNNTFTNLTLTADSTVGGLYDFRIQKASYGATTINLGANTLTKTGTNEFMLVMTTVKGATGGTIDVQGGNLQLNENMSFDEGLAIKIGSAGSVGIRSGKSVTLGAIVGDGGTLNNAGTISAFTLSGTLTLVNAGTYGTITMADGAVAKVGNRRNLTFAGAGTVDVTLTTQEEGTTTEITAFNLAAEATTTVGNVYDSTGADVTSHVTKNGNKFTINHEAKAGSTYYITLAKAIGGAAEGSTITALTDIATGDGIAVDKNITLDGAGCELTGTGFTGAGTLTIIGGRIGVEGLPTAYALQGGEYPAAKVTGEGAWTVADGYHLVDIYSTEALTYSKQVAIGSSPAAEDEKSYPVKPKGGSEVVGAIVVKTSDLVEKGIVSEGATAAQVSEALGKEGANHYPTWQNVVLGLDNNVETSIPYPAPVQGTSNGQISLKLGDNVKVDTASGAKVTYKVKTRTDSGWTTLPTEYGYGDAASVDLPDTGVKYYQFDVIVTPAK